MSPVLLEQLQTVLGAIIAALGAFIVKRISDQTAAMDRREKKEASFESALTVEQQSRRRGSDRPPMTPEEKLKLALRLANDATPDRIKVEPRDIEQVLPRVRASLPAESVLDSIQPGEPIPVAIVSSIPAEPDAAAERITLPRPAPMPKGPVR